MDKIKYFTLCSIILISFFAYGQNELKRPPAISKPVKYTVELVEFFTKKSWDGGSDYQEELYGSVSVCLAAANFPACVQLDYVTKNIPDKEINGGVPPIAQSTNPNGRILWRQTDGKNDRKINLTSGGWANKVAINTKSVFIFDPKKDPYAALRLYADMWEADPSDDDEHFNNGLRRISVPLSELPIGTSKTYYLEIWDSSSRHAATIKITAVAGQ